MSIEMSSDKFVDLCLRCRMQILEFVHSLELCNIETIRHDTVRLSFEKVLALKGGDVRYCCKDIRAMRC